MFCLFVIVLLAPKERYLPLLPGRFPDLIFKKATFPSETDSGIGETFSFQLDITVAGTVPDLHRIPFYTVAGWQRYHQNGGKGKFFFM